MDQTRPPNPRTQPAPAQDRTRTAVPSPQPKAAPPQPAIHSGPPASHSQDSAPENLAITPQLAGADASSLEFDWEPVMMGSNRSCVCAVSASDGGAVSVTLTQGIYRKTLAGDRIVKVGGTWKFAERVITMDASSFKAPK